MEEERREEQEIEQKEIIGQEETPITEPDSFRVEAQEEILQESDPVIEVDQPQQAEEAYQSFTQGKDVILQDDQQKEAFSVQKKRPWKKKVAAFVGTAAAFGIIAGFCFLAVTHISKEYFSGNQTMIENTKTISNGDNSQTNFSAEPQVADASVIVQNVMPSIVSITSMVSESYHDFFGNTYNQESQGSGSGIIVGQNQNELLLVTNHHVIANAKTIKVTFIDNSVLTAQVKGKDTAADLAVLSVKRADLKEETAKAIKVAVLGDSDKVRVGENVLAIGNALGYGQSVTGGYISAKDRNVTVDGNTMTLLQTDAAINPGNSGGALINRNGEVIGINSVKYADSAVEGMGYAIPISKAAPIIHELMKKEQVKSGDEGYLGVIMGQDVTEEISSMYNMPVGAYVQDTAKNGAAAKAGIQKGDIITAVNGMETKTRDMVKEKVSGYAAGTQVTITVQRPSGTTYQKKEIPVTLEKQTEKQEKTTSGKTYQFDQNGNASDQEENTTSPFGYDFFGNEK